MAYAEATDDSCRAYGEVHVTCEAILLSLGKADEAYQRHAFGANHRSTNLATFRAIVAKYPDRTPASILLDLAASTPGAAEKWFAAAKSTGLYDTAIALVNQSPCDPRTLTRAARKAAESHPTFAMEAGLAALRWIAAGDGYEITSRNIDDAYQYTMKAATNAGCRGKAEARIQALKGNGRRLDFLVL